MIRPRAIVVAVLVGIALGVPRASRGDDVPVNPLFREAAEHFERGVKLYEEQDWRAALIEFERAYSIAPRYTVLYNIGQCRYQLKDYAGSLAAFEKYLTMGGTLQGSPEEQQRVEATVDELRGRVARVLVTADVDGAEISVDDVVVGTTPLPSSLVVSEGRRKLAASKMGHMTATRTIDVAGHDSTEVQLRLEPVPPAEAPRVVVRPPQLNRSVVPAVAMFGLAAVGLGVGTVFGLVAVGNKSSLGLECADAECPPSAASQISALKRNAIASTIGFSAGAAGIIGGIGYVLLAPGRTEAGRVRPFIGPGIAGATGSFW